MQERRFLSQRIRSLGNNRTIQGYASIYDNEYDVGGQFVERIAKGCFARALRERQNVAATMNHDINLIVGRVASGTLKLSEDSRGLFFSCDVARTSTGDDLLALVRRGDLSGCSMAFQVRDDFWDEVDDLDDIDRSRRGRKKARRTVRDADLLDVSIVTEPANAAASVVGVGQALDEPDNIASITRMFPAGPPASAPVELRNRILRALSPAPHLDMEERVLRARALEWASKLD